MAFKLTNSTFASNIICLFDSGLTALDQQNHDMSTFMIFSDLWLQEYYGILQILCHDFCYQDFGSDVNVKANF